MRKPCIELYLSTRTNSKDGRTGEINICCCDAVNQVSLHFFLRIVIVVIAMHKLRMMMIMMRHYKLSLEKQQQTAILLLFGLKPKKSLIMIISFIQNNNQQLYKPFLLHFWLIQTFQPTFLFPLLHFTGVLVFLLFSHSSFSTL